MYRLCKIFGNPMHRVATEKVNCAGFVENV